jgi:copper(I)-binding protein
MVIRNEGAAADVFIGARSDAAGNVGLHQTVMKGQVVGMEPVSRVEVPAGGRLELQPGGLHFMLSNLKQNLMPGQRIRLILQFEKAGEVSVEAEVSPLTGEPMSTPLPTGHGH